jgi:hypothetical protein
VPQPTGPPRTPIPHYTTPISHVLLQ